MNYIEESFCNIFFSKNCSIVVYIIESFILWQSLYESESAVHKKFVVLK